MSIVDLTRKGLVDNAILWLTANNICTSFYALMYFMSVTFDALVSFNAWHARLQKMIQMK